MKKEDTKKHTKNKVVGYQSMRTEVGMLAAYQMQTKGMHILTMTCGYRKGYC